MSGVVQERVNEEPRLADRDEHRLLQQFVNKVQEAGLEADRSAIVNLYVALKSKPMALLVGPAGSGKNVVIRCLAEVLAGGNPLRCQLMAGHAWWAEQTGHVAQFATGQARFNDQKLLSLIEEALQPENRDVVHLAGLIWISRAELSTVFSDLAAQLPNRIRRLSTIWLQQGLPYPPNLRLIGTMDVTAAPEVDAGLYAHTTVVSWAATATQRPAKSAASPSHDERDVADRGMIFLSAAIRDEHLAWEKLAGVVGWQQINLKVWRAARAIIHKHGVTVPDVVQAETIIYLANAWDGHGSGLFANDVIDNLTVAQDFALAQLLLPRLRRELREVPSFVADLERLAGARLPVSSAWLKALQ